MESQKIIGSKMSIITTAQIRYEGIITELDPVNKSMRLIRVKGFGSEGRRGGVNEVQAPDNEIEEVTFKVDHLKDFKILEKPNPILIDPAIISASDKASAAEGGVEHAYA